MDKIKTYQKKDSFIKLENKKNFGDIDLNKKILKLLNDKKITTSFINEEKDIIEKLKKDFSEENHEKNNTPFKLKPNTIAEINTFNNNVDIIKYLVHRYKYEIYPILKKITDYPPLIQIEPSSICNFRCVFCFETDKTFTDKKSGHMGTMKLELFKNIIDEIEGKVQFVTLASRGEPLVSKEINKMIEYTSEKFLNLKINTNASLLNEDKIHTILSSNVKTLVFSADAADSDLYKKLRVNGSLEKTVSNIKKFKEIQSKHYSKSKIITRVSGVKFSKEQNFESMMKLWGDLVDQVAFVDYNPWENSYEKESNGLTTPCSDLWRRMFVWWDGKINPCDVDYKSKLSVGNISDGTIKKLWNSSYYSELRKNHLSNKRQSVSPCNACTVI
jgi:radical SAM protein with 4Fe4S-binding SPASM domain